jgi:hypothetical protein
MSQLAAHGARKRRISGFVLAWLALGLLASVCAPLLATSGCECCDGDRCPITAPSCPHHAATSSMSQGDDCVCSAADPTGGEVRPWFELRPGRILARATVSVPTGCSGLPTGVAGTPSPGSRSPEVPPPREG